MPVQRTKKDGYPEFFFTIDGDRKNKEYYVHKNGYGNNIEKEEDIEFNDITMRVGVLKSNDYDLWCEYEEEDRK
jgi:hypothetical protein